MKQFRAVMVLVILVGCSISLVSGCATPAGLNGLKHKSDQFFKTSFGESAGVDPRAREIEKRLGF